MQIGQEALLQEFPSELINLDIQDCLDPEMLANEIYNKEERVSTFSLNSIRSEKYKEKEHLY